MGLADTIGRLSRWGDHVVKRTLLGNPVAGDMDEAAKPDALRDAIAALHTRARKSLTESERERLTDVAKRVPIPAARAAALILRVSDRAILARDRAIRRLDRTGLSKIEGLSDRLGLSESGDSAGFRDRLNDFEFGHLLAAAQELGAASHLAARLLTMTPPASVTFRWDTPFGRIVINGTGDTVYEDD